MGIIVSAGQRFGGSGSSSCNSCHLGHENIIDCVSGIFLRKTHAGCGFFLLLQATPTISWRQKQKQKHPIQNRRNERSSY